MRLAPEVARRRFLAARVARLATVGKAGQPHLVPVTFALLTAETNGPAIPGGAAAELVVYAVDHKPKSSTALRRLANIADNPRVSFLVDHYDEDWDRLWWARADAVATVLEGTDRLRAINALRAKYPQYERQPPAGVVVGSGNTRWSGWQAAE